MSTNAEFVKTFAAKLGTNERAARKTLRAFVNAMQEVMAPQASFERNGTVLPRMLEIRGLGTFYRVNRPKRRQLHPVTRELVFTRPQVVVAFRAGKALRKVMP